MKSDGDFLVYPRFFIIIVQFEDKVEELLVCLGKELPGKLDELKKALDKEAVSNKEQVKAATVNSEKSKNTVDNRPQKPETKPISKNNEVIIQKLVNL